MTTERRQGRTMRQANDKDPAGHRPLDVVIVGAGQAGLAMAWHLAR
jgi:ribulose 1,5-bisphosphate synthetase/thiazole synthase